LIERVEAESVYGSGVSKILSMPLIGYCVDTQGFYGGTRTWKVVGVRRLSQVLPPPHSYRAAGGSDMYASVMGLGQQL